MKGFFVAVFTLLFVAFAFGQNEQSPIVAKDVSYKNWTLKSIRTGDDVSLRDAAAGKKLVIVVYFAPWCHNWQHDAPMLQRFYDKYKTNGLEIIAVGEYDPVANMRANLDTFKITFPAVYESENRDQKQKTRHYDYRQSTGDTRGWGSPWYIFLDPAAFEKRGDTLIKRTHVINGEMIETEGEKFIRENLGLPTEETKPVASTSDGKIEACGLDKPVVELKKP